MTLTNRSRRMFVLLLSLLGTAALFLPFTAGISPSEAVVFAVTRGAFPFTSILWAVPFFLTIPILAWQARRLTVDHASAGEIAVTYALSMVAMLSVLGLVTLLLTQMGLPREPNEIISTALCIALAGANMLLLMRNRSAKRSDETTAEVFLLGGYLPDAFFSLVALYPERFLSGWDAGAYVVAVVSVGYLAAIVLLSREKPGGTPGPVEVSGTRVAREAINGS